MDYCILWEFLALSRSAMLSRDGRAVARIKIKHRICCLQNKLKIEENYLYIFISKDFTRWLFNKVLIMIEQIRFSEKKIV